MSRIALYLALALATPGAALASNSFTWTDNNGGVLDGTWSCAAVNGLWTCNDQTTFTNPDGQTSTQQRTKVLDQGQITTTTTGTRINGHSYSRIHIRHLGDR